MTPCHHVIGHRSAAHGALCLAIRRAGEHRHFRPEWVGGVDPSRLLVRAYEAETGGNAAALAALTRELDAFAATAKAYVDGAKPDTRAAARRAA